MAVNENVDLRVRMQGARAAAADANRVGRSVRGIGKDSEYAAGKTSLLSKGAGALARTMKTGLLFGVGAVGAEVVRATKGWYDHQQVLRRTNAVIKSTQGAANVTAKHVGNLTDAIERQTGVDGDLAQQGANMLLTFTNIRNGVGKNNKVFDSATRTTTNMAKALGEDTQNAALQLGKALNDPVKGITALRRVGVSFNDEQTKQITNLVKSGKTMQAQKIILRELGKEFPKVKATPFERLQVTFHALEDTIGGALLPIFNKGIDALNKFMQGAMNGTGAGGKFIAVLKGIGGTVQNVVGWFKQLIDRYKQGKTGAVVLVTAIATLTAAFVAYQVATTGVTIATKLFKAAQDALNFAMKGNPIVRVITVLVLLGTAIYMAYKKSQTFRNIVHAVWNALKVAGKWIANAGVNTWHALGKAVGWVWKIFKLTPTGFILTHLGKIVDFVKSLPGKIAAGAKGMWEGLKSGFVSILNWIIDKWNAVADIKFNPMPHINPISTGGGGGGGDTGGGTANGLVQRAYNNYNGSTAPSGPSGTGRLTPAHAGASTAEVHTHVHIDGKEVAHAVTKHALNKKARK